MVCIDNELFLMRKCIFSFNKLMFVWNDSFVYAVDMLFLSICRVLRDLYECMCYFSRQSIKKSNLLLIINIFFKCLQTCSKVFGNASALAKHKLTHSDERKYVCGMCSKAFKRQDHL